MLDKGILPLLSDLDSPDAQSQRLSLFYLSKLSKWRLRYE